MKFDAIDKFNLNKEKKEKKTIILLFFILIFVILFCIFIIYLGNLKGEKLEVALNGISNENKSDILYLIKDRSCLQMILPNFKKRLEQLYFIQKANIYYRPLNTLYIRIIEKKPYCIIYDRNRGIFYQVTDEFYILKFVTDFSLLSLNIISYDLDKIYKKGDKINLIYNKIDLYNEDYLLSEIIVDKGNFFGIPVNNNYIISFGSFVNRTKMENFKLLFSLIDIRKEDERFNKIKYIDLSFPNVARLIIE